MLHIDHLFDGEVSFESFDLSWCTFWKEIVHEEKCVNQDGVTFRLEIEIALQNERSILRETDANISKSSNDGFEIEKLYRGAKMG